MSDSGGFVHTHVAPPEGLQAWREPDPEGQVVAQIQAGVQMRLLERRGAWARVVFSNGWSGWVDGRRIVDAAPPPPAAPPGPPPARPQAQAQPGGPSLDKPSPSSFEREMRAQAEREASGPARGRDDRPAPVADPFAGRAEREPSGPSRGQGEDLAPDHATPAPGGGDPPRSRSIPGLASLHASPALIGAGGVLLGTILSWIRVRGAKSNAFDVPVEFLWNYKSGSSGGGGVKVGIVLLALAIFVGVFAILPGKVKVRRILGGVAIGVAVLYTIQLQRALSAAPAGAPGLLSAIGFGVLITLAGGIAIAIDQSEPPGVG